MVGVVDYGAGNLKSVETALRHLGADFFISSSPEELLTSARLIFPGVGEAGTAMRVLRGRGLDEALVTFARSGRPMLAICIGCQVVLDSSEEANTTCLGLLPGKVRQLPARRGWKVPHMGWNQVHLRRDHEVFRGILSGSSFYFVHSFYPVPETKTDILAETDYGMVFPSVIGRDNIVATQFHPEKSGPEGLRLLANFLEWMPSGGADHA